MICPGKPPQAIGPRSAPGERQPRRRRMKHLKRLTVIKTIVARANFFDDIGDWFHDLSDTNKIKW